jgi:DNA-binding NarL/FixJ family response regulator
MATILIIDDELTRQACKTVLGKHHQILEAGNSDDGLKLFRECRPGLVIIDLLVPNSKGVIPSNQEALGLLSSISLADKPIIIIVYSAFCFEPHLREQVIQNVLVDACLTKDISINHLVEAIFNSLKLL